MASMECGTLLNGDAVRPTTEDQGQPGSCGTGVEPTEIDETQNMNIVKSVVEGIFGTVCNTKSGTMESGEMAGEVMFNEDKMGRVELKETGNVVEAGDLASGNAGVDDTLEDTCGMKRGSGS